MTDSAQQKNDGGEVEKIPRREFVKKLAKKAVWIPPAILTLKARKSFAATVTGVSVSI